LNFITIIAACIVRHAMSEASHTYRDKAAQRSHKRYLCGLFLFSDCITVVLQSLQ